MQSPQRDEAQQIKRPGAQRRSDGKAGNGREALSWTVVTENLQGAAVASPPQGCGSPGTLEREVTGQVQGPFLFLLPFTAH